MKPPAKPPSVRAEALAMLERLMGSEALAAVLVGRLRFLASLGGCPRSSGARGMGAYGFTFNTVHVTCDRRTIALALVAAGLTPASPSLEVALRVERLAIKSAERREKRTHLTPSQTRKRGAS